MSQCNESYAEENIIPILPTKEDDKQRLVVRSQKLAEQGLTHSLKKAPGSKKRKKHAATEISTDAPSGSTEKADPASAPNPNSESKSRSNTGTPTPGNGIKNASTASLAARVLEEENEKKKRRKMMGRNHNIDSLFTKKEDGKKSADFMTRGFSIPTAARR